MPARRSWALRPVTFHYKPELDKTGIPQFGLVAEEVARVDPDLVAARRKRGALYRALRSGERDAAQRVPEGALETVQGLEAVAQQKQIEALTAGLRKVNAQLELSGPAPQTVVGNQ